MPKLAQKRRHTIDSSLNTGKKLKIFPLDIPKRAASKGTVWVCGTGFVGQLGLGWNPTSAVKPKNLVEFVDAVEVAAGAAHTLILTNDGSIYSFGCNEEGALGRDTSDEEAEFNPHQVEIEGKAVMITAGTAHSACLLEDGTVMAWGTFNDSLGSMGLTIEGAKFLPCKILPSIKFCGIASGSDHLVMLSCDGHVYTVGCGEDGQLGRIAQRSATGKSRRGKTELLRPKRIQIQRFKLIRRIWATSCCTFVQEAYGGRIFGFGRNNFKQVCAETDRKVITSPLALNLKDVRKIAGGAYHTIILKHDGSVHAVGHYKHGRLGVGEIQNDILQPTPVTALQAKKITDICCGPAQTFAVTKNGELYAWGSNVNYQLAIDDTCDVYEPKLIELESGVMRLSCGDGHSVFITENNKTLSIFDIFNNIENMESAITQSSESSGNETFIVSQTV